MGVDISLSIRIISTSDENFTDVQLTGLDNLIYKFITGNDIEINNQDYKDQLILSDKEYKKFKLNYDFENEGLIKSEIIDAKDAYPVFNKISKKLKKGTIEALSNDLKNINNITVREVYPYEKVESLLYWYLNFEKQFNIMYGILRTAKEMDCKIQFIGVEY